MSVHIRRPITNWNKAISKRKLLSFLKSQSDSYTYQMQEVLKQNRYDDAQYFKGSADAMRALASELERGYSQIAEYRVSR